MQRSGGVRYEEGYTSSTAGDESRGGRDLRRLIMR